MEKIQSLQDLIGHGASDVLWWQMCIRGVVVFLFGLVLIRLFGRKAFGKQTPLDIVLAIIIGSNLSRALTANARFAPTLAATALIALLYWLLEHLAIRWPGFSRLVKGKPIQLIRNGRQDRGTMRRAAVGEGDLDEAARMSGLNGASDLQEAVLERSGGISATRHEKSGKPL